MFACSGPGAGEAIAESIRTAEIHAAIVAILLLAALSIALRVRARTVPWILVGLLVIHPAWTIDAIRGDCGMIKRAASWVVTGIASAAMLPQIGIALGACRGPPRPTPPRIETPFRFA